MADVDTGGVPPGVAAGLTRIDTLVVSAGDPGLMAAPQVGSVVTRIDLDQARGARDLADILGMTAGLQIRRYGAVGASAVPSLRGSTPAQIRVFIDGMPLDDAQTGLVDLARLPLERFGAVDIHRGGVPVRLGGVGGAGAVNLRTRDAVDGVEANVGAGSWGERSGRAVWGAGQADGDRSGLVLLHGRRADNDFAYTDHKWTFHDPDDDVPRVRENAWLREHGAFAAGHTKVAADWRIRGWAGFLRRDGGRPGPIGGYASPQASVRYDRCDGYLAAGWRDDLVRCEVAGARTDEQLDDPAGEVGLAPPGVTRSRGEELTGRVVVAPRLVAGTAFDAHLQLGVEHRDQWYEEAFNDSADPLRHRRQTTLFAAVDAGLAGGRVQVSPSLRWQRNRDDFPPVPPLPWLPEEAGVVHVRTDWSPALGLVWETVPGRVIVAAHAARTVRVPTWIELYGHRGGIAGNRDLQPEGITSLDLGVTVRPLASVTSRLTVFQSDIDDTIVFVPNSQQTSQGHNIGGSRTTGLEAEVQGHLARGLVLQANATFQRARDRSGQEPYDGKALPYLPDREAFVRLRRDHEVLASWVEVLVQSSNYRDRANTEEGRAAARGQLNAGVDWTWRPGGSGSAAHLTISGAMLNITDRRDHDIEGFPLPGRSWRTSVGYRP